MKALIDGDLICWRCAPVCEGLDLPIALWQTDELVNRILGEVSATDFQVYISSGENNFRYAIYPDYKANRLNKPRPQHLEAIREHLCTRWNAKVVDGYEADDALGIAASDRNGSQSVIASIDKDLLQVPGLHYNFVKREFITITEIEGWRNFYTQLLVGDASDNIPGCPSIGKVKAPRLLASCKSKYDMYQVCLKEYKNQKISIEDMHRNANLLYILRKEEEKWEIPNANNDNDVGGSHHNSA